MMPLISTTFRWMDLPLIMSAVFDFAGGYRAFGAQRRIGGLGLDRIVDGTRGVRRVSRQPAQPRPLLDPPFPDPHEEGETRRCISRDED
jgi:hypothetical protein